LVAGFRVGVTRDLRGPEGPLHDVGLDVLDEAGVPWDFLAEDLPVLDSGSLRGFDAVLVYAPQVPRAAIEGADRLKVVARLGVGTDSVDIPACTERGVFVTVTPDAVRRPLASAAVLYVLALAHALRDKDALVREGRWAERFDRAGDGLTGKTVGIVGLGNIGREICRLIEPFDVRLLAADPFAKAPEGVELVPLERLLEESDHVVVVAPLSPETRHLIDAAALARMKPGAFLVNVARGGLVDQAALTEALAQRRIAGAALDVFEQEPLPPDDPLVGLDNVILAPHAIGVTRETIRALGASACRSVLEVAAGRVPQHAVNKEAAG
jgi:D-3-phosphoglycerate dehydrogenase